MANNEGFVKLEEEKEGSEKAFNEAAQTAMFGKGYQQKIRDPSQQTQQENSVDPAANLQFQDFSLSHQSAFRPPQQPPLQVPLNNTQEDPNLGFGSPSVPQPQPEQVPSPISNPRFWQIEYYHFLFDVDTKQVLNRLIRSLIPFPPTFLASIHVNPDLYGPWWIATTMVFLMAATGNLANYLSHVTSSNNHQHNSTDTSSNTSFQWEYDFNKLSFAAAAIYGYLAVIPLLVFGAMKYLNLPLKLMEILCLYGYSFFVYIPISVLCVLPSETLRWGLVGIAALISSSVLLINFFTVLRESLSKGAIVLLLMGVFHLGFALTCRLYFFQY